MIPVMQTMEGRKKDKEKGRGKMKEGRQKKGGRKDCRLKRKKQK